MQTPGGFFRGPLRIFIFIGLILFILSQEGCGHNRSGQRPNVKRKMTHNLRKNLANAGEVAEAKHPYGNPFRGTLPWEKKSRFQREIHNKNLTIRMAAFQTTLPNPLPGEESNVALAADLLAGTIIKPGEIYSMNQRLGPYGKARGFREGPAYYGTKVVKVTGGGVCKIASTLYNVTTLANLRIVERNSHNMPVPYVPPGQDATVSSSHKDFRFVNNSNGPVLVWADTKGNTLYMAIYGRKKPPAVTWRHKISNRTPFPTVYQKSSRLKPGQKRIVIPGANGVVVKSWVTIHYQDGRSETRYLGADTYKPLPQVIEKG
jgi:vancomycin resistance protein YoaR